MPKPPPVNPPLSVAKTESFSTSSPRHPPHRPLKPLPNRRQPTHQSPSPNPFSATPLQPRLQRPSRRLSRLPSQRLPQSLLQLPSRSLSRLPSPPRLLFRPRNLHRSQHRRPHSSNHRLSPTQRRSRPLPFANQQLQRRPRRRNPSLKQPRLQHPKPRQNPPPSPRRPQLHSLDQKAPCRPQRRPTSFLPLPHSAAQNPHLHPKASRLISSTNSFNAESSQKKMPLK